MKRGENVWKSSDETEQSRATTTIALSAKNKMTSIENS